MNKKQKGGKRPGAGRKASGISKKPVTVYVEETRINEFGDMEATRDAIYAFLKGLVPLPHDYVEVKDVAVVQNKPNTAPEIGYKPKYGLSKKRGQNEAKNEQTGEIPAAPKTLEELKRLCPKDLVGLDRSEWIAENRKKYNI